MKVGLMADTHDRIPAIAELLDVMLSKGVSLVMHAGDYCSPFALDPFNKQIAPYKGAALCVRCHSDLGI